MEKNILLLTDENLPYLTKFNLSMYSQILVTIVAPDGTVAIPVAKQLLAIQSQQKCQIQLALQASVVQKQGVFWAWKLGELAVSSPDAQITILTEDNTLQLLAELCTEQGQSVQVLQVYNTTTESTPAKSDIAQAHNPAITIEEEEDDSSSVATEAADKEERQRRNEQIINSLMKKASTMPYQIAEGKPVSAVKEQEIELTLQVQSG